MEDYDRNSIHREQSMIEYKRAVTKKYSINLDSRSVKSGCCGKMGQMTADTIENVGKHLSCGSCALILFINLILPGIGTLISAQFVSEN